MKSVYILLNSIDKVKNFVSTTTHIEGDLDLVVGRYVVAVSYTHLPQKEWGRYPPGNVPIPGWKRPLDRESSSE